MTQSSDVFRTLSPEECQALLREMREEARPLYRQIERVAAATLKVRPVFLGKQPFPKRCEMIRKAMALKSNAEDASEILAMFFMSCHRDDVEELLDGFALEHEDGVLREPSPAPPADEVVKKAVEEFPRGEMARMRGILLRAFAAQSAIDWPLLDEMVFPRDETIGGTR